VTDERPSRPSPGWRSTLALLERLPQGALSRGAGWLADRPLPRVLRGPVLGGFARLVGLDVEEAEHPLEAYPSLNHFFVRRLRPGIRSWSQEPSVLGSPVDGVAGQGGRVTRGRIIQAKGRTYSAAALLGDDAAAARFIDGDFLTIYLSPRHYHRIHSPCGGRIVEARHIPGGLLPVNPAAVAHVPELFARNERLVVHLDGPLGRMALVAVGATNVGAISARFDPAWGGNGASRDGAGASAGSGRTQPDDRLPAESAVRAAHPPRPVSNRRHPVTPLRRYDPGIPVSAGEEILAFHLGSTVVLLTEPGRVDWDEGVGPGTPVALGGVLGRRHSEDRGVAADRE
jgi:phosphatidylserine decarboxylase